jgi:hypothetical protein
MCFVVLILTPVFAGVDYDFSNAWWLVGVCSLTSFTIAVVMTIIDGMMVVEIRKDA